MLKFIKCKLIKMNYIEVENTYLTYLKLFEGLDIPRGLDKIACDLSFNNGITAKYLINKKNLQKVYVIDNKYIPTNDSIVLINANNIMLNLLGNTTFDLVISLGGITNVSHLYESILNIHKLLNIEGKLLIAIYPDIFNDAGKDLLNLLSNLLNIPVKEKFLRLQRLVYNSISNIFTSVMEYEILQEISINEIKSLFMLDSYTNFLCNNKRDILKFFTPLDRLGKRFFLGWNVLEAIKL